MGFFAQIGAAIASLFIAISGSLGFLHHPQMPVPISTTTVAVANTKSNGFSSASTSSSPWTSIYEFENQPSHIIQDTGQPEYFVKNGEVFFYDDAIQGADPTMFVISSIPYASTYAKDSNHVYYSGSIVSGADPASFMPDEENLDYASDKGHVYCAFYARDDEAVATLEPISTDPTNFTLVPFSITQFSTSFSDIFEYAKDSQHVYLDCEIIPNADPATFKLITDTQGQFTGYSEDANRVYFGFLTDDKFASTTIVSKMPNSFRVLSGLVGGLETQYAEDSANVYFQAAVVPGADPASFEVDNPNIQNLYTLENNPKFFDAHDKNHTYYQGQIVQ